MDKRTKWLRVEEAHFNGMLINGMMWCVKSKRKSRLINVGCKWSVAVKRNENAIEKESKKEKRGKKKEAAHSQIHTDYNHSKWMSAENMIITLCVRFREQKHF